MLCFFASSITTITSATPIRIPGTIPAVNMSAIETPVIDAYTTNAILGGITIAIELEVAISAVENGAENLHMDPEIFKAYNALHQFMFDSVYLNPTCKSEEKKAQQMLELLYDYYSKHIEKMPSLYVNLAFNYGIDAAVCDYIAGMTDIYAVEAFKDLFIPEGWKKI